MTKPTPSLQLELDKLKACIHCGMCLPACPTYVAIGSEAESPRGRLYMMKKLLEGETTPQAVRPHLEDCLACHGCETACPSGVQYGSMLLATREDFAKSDYRISRFFKRWIFKSILPNHRLLLTLGQWLRLYQKSGMQFLLRALGVLKLFPSLAHQESLLPKIPAYRAIHAGLSFGNPSDEPVVLLTGCVMDVMYNPVHWDTVEVLVANGYYVRIPEQTCCGALAHHAGETDITRRLARQNIDLMLRDHPQWVVVNSSGCGSTLKEYGHLLADDPLYSAKAQHFAAKVVDVMELLGRKPLATMPTPVNESVTYHAACHLYHVQKIQKQPIDMLKQVPGLTLIPMTNAEACCGSAGIYNVEKPELSQEILNEKMKSIQDVCSKHNVSTVVTGNPGCLLQLEKGARDVGLKMSVQHPISILAKAYRKSPSPK
jgi:glycolate oxidase iron-sulfur subunit